MGPRDRRRARRGPSGTRYQMRQKLISIGDDYWIENESGERVFKVDGKAVRVRHTLFLEDAGGSSRYKIQERKARVRDTMAVEDNAGNPVATVQQALVSPVRNRWTVKLAAGGDWSVQGNIVDHEYSISGPDGTVAAVSKKWFRVRDTYGVEVSPGHDDALVLAVTVVIDAMTTR